jgi:putative Mg2+ transporter-C (MgtC) family protein
MFDYAFLLDRLRDLIPLVVALACGGFIGLERETRGKPAGIKTAMLICFGSAAFVQSGMHLLSPTVDATRVMGQVITGIGFLGAGAIITHQGQVKGLTTAATIWVTAAVGVALGMGWYVRGILWTLICVGVLQVVSFIERKLPLNGHSSQAAGNDDARRSPGVDRRIDGRRRRRRPRRPGQGDGPEGRQDRT